MTENAQINQETREDRKERLGKFLVNSLNHSSAALTENPWVPDNVDKYGIEEAKEADEYHKAVNSCRFFFRRDPLASIVLNRMSEIAINKLHITKSGVKETEIPIYEAVLEGLTDFLQSASLEYLISGLVMPNVSFRRYNAREIARKGIKYKKSLILPDFYWLRDPTSIVINTPFGQTII